MDQLRQSGIAQQRGRSLVAIVWLGAVVLGFASQSACRARTQPAGALSGVASRPASRPANREATLAFGSALVQLDEAGVRRAIEAGADVNWVPPATPRGRSQSALAVAARNDSLSLVRLLLKHGADVNADGPLQYAAIHNNVELARALLKAGAEPDYTANTPEVSFGTPLAYAAQRGHVAVMKLLIAAGASVNSGPGLPKSLLPIVMAAESGSVEAAKLLSKAGATITARERDGRTALHAAAWLGHKAMIRWLLERGADPRAKDNRGHTPEDLAREGKRTAVALMLKRAAEKNKGK